MNTALIQKANSYRGDLGQLFHLTHDQAAMIAVISSKMNYSRKY